MKRRTFKPYTSTPVDKEKVYLKGLEGGDYQIDVKDIEIILQKLVPYSDKQVKEAPQEELEEISNTVDVLCNTEYYPALREVIIKYFPVSPPPIPGSVKAYMIGCSVKSDPCSSICAGSAPANSNFNVCTDKVLIGVPLDRKYSFTVLNESSSSKAILYLPISRKEDFSGFTEQDVKELERLKIKQVKIMQNKEDVVLYDYTNIESFVKSPPAPPFQPTYQPAAPVYTSQPNYTIWIILAIIVVIILVALVLLYKRRM